MGYNILLDNGHGVDTLGKCSPDGQFKEYKFSREIVCKLYRKLQSLGYNAIILVPEEQDISLKERVARANEYYDSNKNTILISIHADASPEPGWQDARGWSGWVSKNASQNSKNLCGFIYDEIKKTGVRMRQYLPNQKYWQANYYILSKSKCPAVLTENGFQTNKEDVAYMESDDGQDNIVNAHVQGIINYINSKS